MPTNQQASGHCQLIDPHTTWQADGRCAAERDQQQYGDRNVCAHARTENKGEMEEDDAKRRVSEPTHRHARAKRNYGNAETELERLPISSWCVYVCACMLMPKLNVHVSLSVPPPQALWPVLEEYKMHFYTS